MGVVLIIYSVYQIACIMGSWRASKRRYVDFWERLWICLCIGGFCVLWCGFTFCMGVALIGIWGGD